MGSVQRRIGPSKVGQNGLLQPISDGLKQIQKDTIIPIEAIQWWVIFNISPVLTLILPLISWYLIPISHGLSYTEYVPGTMQIQIAISELSIYGVILSGWSSNSKYGQLGSYRSTAQLISYGITQSIIFISVIQILGTVDIQDIYRQQQGKSNSLLRDSQYSVHIHIIIIPTIISISLILPSHTIPNYL